MEALMDQISPFISLKMTNAGNFVPSAAAHNATVKQLFFVVFSRAPVMALHWFFLHGHCLPLGSESKLVIF